MNTKKQAFTLVELIVVITILAILWTIAFISLQWFSKDARNSTRSEDMSNIQKVLDLYRISHWNYPTVSNGTNVTYSWWTIWTQWTFWEDTRRLLWTKGQISTIPVDPLTGNEYTYSVLNTWNEMQLAWVYEWDLLLNQTTNTYAAWAFWTTKIIWNYNWQVAKVQTGALIYILAVPTIISWNIELTDIESLIYQKKLVFNWWWVIPASYSWTTNFNERLPSSSIVNNWSIKVYETSDLNDLKDTDNQKIIIEKLKIAYINTELSNTDSISDIININTVINPEEALYISQVLINNNINNIVKVTAKSNSSDLYSLNVFISTWNVWIDTWVSWFNKVKLPLQSNWTYNFTVDWWDWTAIQTITSYNQAEATHTYSSSWIYNVIIDWIIDGFAFNAWNAVDDNLDDWDKLIDVKQWWNLKLSDWWNQFSNCENLLYFSANDIPDLSSVTIAWAMFWLATSFNWNINNWDVSNITNMAYMFRWANSFNQPLDKWNVSNVTNMTTMFYDASLFNQNLNNWDISNVQDMSWMFSSYYSTVAFNQDLTNWNSKWDNITVCSNFDYNANSWVLPKPTFANCSY